jgi:hypothetical protein
MRDGSSGSVASTIRNASPDNMGTRVEAILAAARPRRAKRNDVLGVVGGET